MISPVRGVPRFCFILLAPIVVLAGLLLFAPPDGNERAQLLQFVGRFHPLSVHLPIALLVLAPLLELAGRSRRFSYLLPANNFLLGVAAGGALLAALLGWCLARGGGYSGPLVTQHMWAGVSVAAAAWLCWSLRVSDNTIGLRRAYAGTLVATVVLVSLTGYRGGQLSQGENHLTEFMPEPLAAVLRLNSPDDIAVNSPSNSPSTLYGARIRPVFLGHCTTCHGRNKHKANLRLDSYEALMRGGKHGLVIKPGEPRASELLRRITLSPSDDDFMPPDNRRPLSRSDVKLIEQWIALGASGTQPPDALKDVPVSSTAEVSFEEVDPATVAKQRASLAPALASLQQRLPNVLDYESRASSDIVVNAAWMGEKFGDAELAALAPLSDRIVMADFSSTAITDKSAAALGAMKHLRTLRLMHTRVTDATVASLGSLQQLETLSVFDTPVTAASLPALTHLPKLQRIYVIGTKISAEAPVPPELRQKLVF